MTTRAIGRNSTAIGIKPKCAAEKVYGFIVSRALILRWKMISVLFCFVRVAPLFLLVDRALAQTDVKDIEQKAIAYRSKNVQRGFVRLHVVNDIDIDPTQQAEFMYEITFDGEDRIKQTRRIRLLGNDKWGDSTTHVVNKDSAIYDYSPETPVHVVTSKQYGNLKEHFMVLNPRPLGMDLSGTDMLHKAQLESLLNRADRSVPTVHSELMEGLEAFRIEYTLGKGDVKVWIVPNQGYSIIKAEFQISKDGKPFRRAIQTKLKQYPVDQVWYPQQLIKTDEDQGKVVSRQIVNVVEARFGGSIAESEFDLGSLGLRLGRDVIDSTKGIPLGGVWNGTEVVAPSTIDKKTMPADGKWRFIFPGIALGIAAFFFLIRAFRKKKSQPAS